MNEPLITTIIPTYKRPKLLKRAIMSALNQTFSDLQVYVYDNASDDETEEIVRECIEKDARVKYHRHHQNIGLLRNYQYGLSEVKTDYFSFLSDDDVLFPWFYEEALHPLRQFPECAFSAGSAVIMSEEGKVIRVPLDLWKREGVFAPPGGLLEMISKYPVPSCILFHKKVIDEIPIDMSNALTWDCDFLLQIAARYPFHISKRPCGIFLHHHSSYSSSKGLENWNSSLKRMIERIDFNPHLDSEVKKTAIELINVDLKNMNRSFILQSLFNRKFQEACDDASLFRKNYGLNLKTLFFLNLTRLCRSFPFVLHPLSLVRKLKNFKRERLYRLNYKKYAKWLTFDNG
ncbi:MAG: glycosyltransferase family A protein [Rhabdochlamydiaceae bacterium]